MILWYNVCLTLSFLKKGDLMSKQYLPRPFVAVGLVALLLVSLTLAACGGGESTESEESSASTAQTEEAAGTPAEVEAETAESEAVPPPTEEMEAQEAETTEESGVSEVAGPVAECQSVDIPDNDLIAAVTDRDWSKGPADAPITLVEYGDFQ